MNVNVFTFHLYLWLWFIIGELHPGEVLVVLKRPIEGNFVVWAFLVNNFHNFDIGGADNKYTPSHGTFD